MLATNRYVERHGYQYAGGITYFSLLSLVPLLMIVFSGAGLILAGSPDVMEALRSQVIRAVPAPLAPVVGLILDRAVADRGQMGLVGIVFALYSGWNWITSLRDALTAMGGADRPDQRLIPMVAKDMLALLGLLAALLLSFGLTSAGTAFGDFVFRLAGLDGSPVSQVPLSLLALVSDVLTFGWVLARLPREPVRMRSAIRGAVVMSVGFEALKLLAGVYLDLIKNSPVMTVFGSVLGLFVFVYLVARMLLFVAAWVATAHGVESYALRSVVMGTWRSGPGGRAGRRGHRSRGNPAGPGTRPSGRRSDR